MKQAIALTLTVLLVFALASCGTDKDQLAYALGHRDSPWNSVEYSPYTAGIAEPEFYYEIMGVNQAEGLCLEFSSEGDELSTWKDSLLTNGFIITHTDAEMWAAESVSHGIQILGNRIYIIGKTQNETSAP